MAHTTEYMHAYYVVHPEKFVKKPGANADFYARNKGAENKRCSEYKAEHKNEISEYNKNYAKEHLEELKAKQKVAKKLHRTIHGEELREKDRIRAKEPNRMAQKADSEIRRNRAMGEGESCTDR